MRKLGKMLTVAVFSVVTMFIAVIGVNAVISVKSVTLTANDKVTVTRNVTGVTNKVVNKFGYTITEGNNNPAAVEGAPKTLEIEFNGTETIADKSVTKTGTISFEGATFTTPGDYEFVVTEVSSENNTTYPVKADSYRIFVEVRYNAAGELVGRVLSQGVKVGETAKSNIVFPADSRFTNITVTNKVTGDMGDPDKYFDVVVTVPGKTGDVYTITGGSKDGNPTTIAANTPTTIALKNDESVTIGVNANGLNELPIGGSYTVTATPADNYTTTVDNTSVNTVNKQTVITPSENVTSIVNDYSMSALTGVVMNVLPFIVLIIASILGIVILKKQNN